jgi:ABC-type multidrug transport system fused ATPase/permease subunit
VILANPITAWLKRWGLWILLGLAVVLYLLTRLLPSPKGKPELVQEAKDGAAKLKEEAAKASDELAKKMAENKKELEEIKAIADEKERLRRLAEFANRRKV